MEKHRERILLISVNNFYGGGEVHLRNLARLLEDCCEIHALVFDKTLADDLEFWASRFIESLFSRKSMRFLQVVHAFFVLPFLVVKHRIRSVVISGTIEAILLLPMKIMGRRTISTRHLSPFLGHGSIIRKGRRLLIEAIYGAGILFADHVVCVSESVAEGMRKIALHKRIRVIPNWVPSIPEKNAPAGMAAAGPPSICRASRAPQRPAPAVERSRQRERLRIDRCWRRRGGDATQANGKG